MKKRNRINTEAVSHHKIDAEADGRRIDNYLIQLLEKVPKSHIYRLLRRGEVRVNKGRVKPVYKLKEGDLLRLPPIKLSQGDDEKIPKNNAITSEIEVIYEDDALYIINKPPGWAVHGGSGISYGLVELLRQTTGYRQLELAHRLDRDTSGCLLMAKKNSVLKKLHEQLREGDVKKTYQCLVFGKWPASVNRCEAKLLKGQISNNERVVKVNEAGKPSKTTFQRLGTFASATHMQASPKTGRTHQIRVHAAHLGYPLLGDDKYGTREAKRYAKEIGLKRLFLHASSVAFNHPTTDELLQLSAPLPEDLQQILDKLS